MTDNNFQKVLFALGKAKAKYDALLEKAETEIEKRYGVNPCDIDNDQWIDCYHQGCGSMTVAELHESMKLHMREEPKRLLPRP
jgi:hypothetical protein